MGCSEGSVYLPICLSVCLSVFPVSLHPLGAEFKLWRGVGGDCALGVFSERGSTLASVREEPGEKPALSNLILASACSPPLNRGADAPSQSHVSLLLGEGSLYPSFSSHSGLGQLGRLAVRRS